MSRRVGARGGRRRASAWRTCGDPTAGNGPRRRSLPAQAGHAPATATAPSPDGPAAHVVASADAPPSALRSLRASPLTRVGARFASLGQTALPPSRNSRFQFEIDCSDAFPRRAASATRSPEMTERTSRYLSSTEKTEGRATGSSLHEEPDTNPPARIRDAGHMKPGAVHSVSTGAPGGRWSSVGCSLHPQAALGEPVADSADVFLFAGSPAVGLKASSSPGALSAPSPEGAPRGVWVLRPMTRFGLAPWVRSAVSVRSCLAGQGPAQSEAWDRGAAAGRGLE